MRVAKCTYCSFLQQLGMGILKGMAGGKQIECVRETYRIQLTYCTTILCLQKNSDSLVNGCIKDNSEHSHLTLTDVIDHRVKANSDMNYIYIYIL